MALNPDLYRRLQRVFGAVRISNPGVTAHVMPYRSAFGDGSVTVNVDKGGEYYLVCCPFCGDRRYRLEISYLYNATVAGQVLRFAAHCFNENCLATAENRRRLFDTLYGFANRGTRATLPTVHVPVTTSEASAASRVVRPPGVVWALRDLPADHEAVDYLFLQRDFDPEYLSERFGVGYVVNATAPECYPAALAIYIPVMQQGRLIGWQTRKPTDKSSGYGKYFNSPGWSKASCLYNQDRAANCPVVVLVEGALDVWRVGSAGTATFGKTVSTVQARLLQQVVRNRPLAIAYDDVAAVNQAYERLSGLTRFPVYMPDGMDPADHSQDAFWRLLYAAAQQWHVTIPEFDYVQL